MGLREGLHVARHSVREREFFNFKNYITWHTCLRVYVPFLSRSASEGDRESEQRADSRGPHRGVQLLGAWLSRVCGHVAAQPTARHARGTRTGRGPDRAARERSAEVGPRHVPVRRLRTRELGPGGRSARA